MAGDCVYNKHCTKEATSFSKKHLLDCKQEAGGDVSIDSVGEKALSSPFYEVIDGVLYRKKLEKGYINYREVLDADRRLGAIATFHQKRNGALHLALEDTYRFVAENYWWEGMFFHIRDYVLGCKECTGRRVGMHVYEETITKTLVSHGTDILKKLNSQRDEGLFCDITLIVDGATYSAHKAVLAAVSEYFKEMFTEMDSTSNHKSAVDLTGFSPDSFLPLLEFSYTSTLSLKLENLTEICAMARHFRMWSVVELCKGIQKEQMDNKDYPGIQRLGGKHFIYTPTPTSVEISGIKSIVKSQQDSPPSFGKDEKYNNETPNSPDYIENSRCRFMESNVKDSAKSKAHVLENSFKCTLGASEELSTGKLPRHYSALQKAGLLDKQTFSTPMKRLKLLDFKSSSKKRKSSPKNLSCTKISPSHHNPNWAMVSPKQDKKEISLQGITTAPIQANYKKQLRFSLPDERTQERLEICAETFKSPVKTEPVEDEVQSPNTAEKYKLLHVLGLQRKSLIVCGEELTGWRQKKRLRKLKACSYSLTTRRKRSMGNLNSGAHRDDKQSLPEGKINLGIIKDEKTESEISPVHRHKVTLRRRGYGWTRSKVASVKLRVAAEHKALQVIPNATEKTTVGCNRGRKLESRQLPSVRPGKVQISKHIKKEMQAKQSVFTGNHVRGRRLGLVHTNKPLFLSAQVNSPIAEECSVADLSRGSTNKNIRLLRSIRQTEKSNNKYVCVGKKAALVGARRKLDSHPLQKGSAPSESPFFSKKEVGKAVKQTKSGNADARNQRFRSSTCKVQLSSGLGKRKTKPSQKLLDAGFLFNLHRLESTKEVAGSSSVKRDSKKHELCLTATSVSKLSSKKIRGSGPQTSEILGRTRGAIKNAEAVLVLGRKLLKVKGNRPLVKRSESCWSAEGRGGKCDISRTASRKMANVQLLADLGSTFDCTDGLPKVVDMKTKLPRFAEVIKRTRVKRLKARVSTNSSCSSIAVSSHTCSECRDSFKNCDSLIMHKIRHIEGKHWPCPLCKKTFFRQKNVQNHVRTHNQMLYRCKLCMK
ncbi:uncharacterized protein LOC121320712 [Polyodon spathula]|uniref:uncharacterized protein LOC121320712 n=1 Tax=Polyodon spathula TaxID=7913 RepID=UPI001B7F6FCB|nr:uncharacterized protein LOC121320712 [Polyodon spathula]XP_041115221.1 uncharacterized protein LOC121320712 [Polyodon spathula]